MQKSSTSYLYSYYIIKYVCFFFFFLLLLLFVQKGTKLKTPEERRKWKCNPDLDVSITLQDTDKNLEVILRKLTHKRLGPGEWKKLAHLWAFTDEQIKAIEHQYIGKIISLNFFHFFFFYATFCYYFLHVNSAQSNTIFHVSRGIHGPFDYFLKPVFFFFSPTLVFFFHSTDSRRLLEQKLSHAAIISPSPGSKTKDHFIVMGVGFFSVLLT